MKLGLIINSTSAGEQEVFSINKEREWARYATDSRSIIKNLEGFDGSGKSVIIAKILGSLGYLIGIVRARPEGSGRPNDNTTAWIHVPAKLKITGNELLSVITSIEGELSAQNGINPDLLNELFTKEYDNKNVQYSAFAFIGLYNLEGSIGWRDYGNGTDFALQELLGDSLAQSSYKKYKCICFVDKSLILSTVGGEKIKLDPKEPKKIEAPVDNQGFRAFIKINNQEIPFTDALEIPANTPLLVVWKKDGYSDIKKEIKIDNHASLDIQEYERKFIFKRSWIKVTDYKGNIIDAEILVNNKPFTTDIMEIAVATIRDGIKIHVSHSGYEPKEEVINQISSNLKTKFQWFAIGVASVFILGLLWTGYKALDNWVDNHEFQLGWPPITEVKKQATYSITSKDADLESNKAIVAKDSLKEKVYAYLRSNDIWYKDSLAKYDLTKNLFDDMNSFNIENLIMLESSELKEVKQIQELIDAARLSKKDNIKPSIGKEDNDNKYNSAKDLGININNYISWITKEHTAIQKNEKVNATSESSKKKENTKSSSIKKEQSASDSKKTDKIRGGI